MSLDRIVRALEGIRDRVPRKCSTNSGELCVRLGSSDAPPRIVHSLRCDADYEARVVRAIAERVHIALEYAIALSGGVSIGTGYGSGVAALEQKP